MGIWKDVVGFEGLYEVSNIGRVRSIDRAILRSDGTYLNLKGKILPQYKKCGNSSLPRLYVNLSKKGKAYTKTVSRLVAMAFLENKNNYPEVNHKDENPLNNNVLNLEWCTSEYNHNFGTRNKRQAEKLYKKVNVFDLNHVFIKKYDSIKSAAEDLNCDPSSITKVCKGKNKYHNGCIFEYAD